MSGFTQAVLIVIAAPLIAVAAAALIYIAVLRAAFKALNRQ